MIDCCKDEQITNEKLLEILKKHGITRENSLVLTEKDFSENRYSEEIFTHKNLCILCHDDKTIFFDEKIYANNIIVSDCRIISKNEIHAKKSLISLNDIEAENITAKKLVARRVKANCVYAKDINVRFLDVAYIFCDRNIKTKQIKAHEVNAINVIAENFEAKRANIQDTIKISEKAFFNSLDASNFYAKDIFCENSICVEKKLYCRTVHAKYALLSEGDIIAKNYILAGAFIYCRGLLKARKIVAGISKHCQDDIQITCHELVGTVVAGTVEFIEKEESKKQELIEEAKE